MPPEITPDVAHSLGHYVYAYVDPRDGEVFYIGKGIGPRATAHLTDNSESQKVCRIKDIQSAGLEPRIDIIAYGLRDEQEAFRVEAALIELVGLKNLTNKVHGSGASEYPRRPLADFVLECAPSRVDVDVPCLLIRINHLFGYGMDDNALYEATRGIWVIGARRERAVYAMAVFAGIVREVYEIERWHPAGSTPYKTRDQAELTKRSHRRWEFDGHLAPSIVRDKFRGCFVGHLLPHGLQSPVVGVGL